MTTASPSGSAAGAPEAPHVRKRREPELTFLRLVPVDSPVHRLWPGTKLILAAELALIGSIAPSWLTLGVLSLLVLIGLLVGRIPLGAFPRLPRIVWALLAFGLFLDSLSTTPPIVHVGPVPISAGALGEAMRFLALGIVLIVSAAVVGWTTQLGAVAPALARLTRPLRVLRLPVDEWIVAIALALRCLPLLIDEMRTLAAARRLRYRDPSQQKQFRGAVIEVHDIVSTAIIVSLRRAHDLADAITARGGMGAIGDGHDGALGWNDAATLVVVTAIVVALFVASRH
jgi:energy-coupling factor transporter transmembrane protein EcfT